MKELKISGRTELFYSTLDVIEDAVKDFGEKVVEFRRCHDADAFDAMLKAVQKSQAMFGNIMTFLQCRAFTFDVVPAPEADTESAV